MIKMGCSSCGGGGLGPKSVKLPRSVKRKLLKKSGVFNPRLRVVANDVDKTKKTTEKTSQKLGW
jgi:hypothetical protein